MFANDFVIDFNGTSRTLTKINQDKYSSEYLYRSSIEEMRLFIRHSSYIPKGSNQKTDRHNLELVWIVYPVAPSTTPLVQKTYAVMEKGYSDVRALNVDHVLGFAGVLNETNIPKLFNWES